MNALLKAVVFASVATCSLLAHAVAPVTSTYTDEAAFLNQLTSGSVVSGGFSTPVETYDSLTSITSAGVTFTSNGFTLFQSNNLPNTFYLLDATSNIGYGLPDGSGFISTQNGVNPGEGPSTLNIMTAAIGSSGMTAVGFTYGNQGTGSSDLTISLSNGFQVQTSFGAQSASKFIGFVSNVAITSVTFAQSSSAAVVFDVTKVVVGAAPVPEPSTTLMFGVGLVFLGAIGRRKMRKA